MGRRKRRKRTRWGATPASFRQSEMSDSFRKRVPNHARRRSGVSAEVMSPGILRREEYTPVVHEKPAEVRTALQDMLGENILFKDLDAAQMTTLLDAMFMANFEAGKAIIEQGAEGDNFYVVFEGECEVFVSKGGDEKMVLACGKGDSFGELSLLKGETRAATVTSEEETTLLIAPRRIFLRHLGGEVLSRRTQWRRVFDEVFTQTKIRDYDKNLLADAVREHRFAAGKPIPPTLLSHCLAIVQRGSVRVESATGAAGSMRR